MKDKITKLSKGITDIESPVINVTPGLFSDSVFTDRRNTFSAELVCTNGLVIKGIAFPDNVRVSVEPRTFSGRRIHLNIDIDILGLELSDVICGEITLMTNGGELKLPYEFIVDKNEQAAAVYPLDNAVAGSHENIAQSGTDTRAGTDIQSGAYAEPVNAAQSTWMTGKDSDSEYGSSAVGTDPVIKRHELLDGIRDPLIYEPAPKAWINPEDGGLSELLAAVLPEDEPLFEGILTELVRSGDISGYAFAMYSEAIRRGINITRLYECYVRAYPADTDEMMPREILLYFSYEREAKPAILKKIYRNILTNVDRNTELYAYYEPAMSSFAVNCALAGLIDDDLAMIYDRMIYPGMTDRRAAAVFPDIFKCSRIRLINGQADFITVSYPGLKTRMHAQLQELTAYIPVYFKDADIRAYRIIDADYAQDVTDKTETECTALFARPDILRRCFELVPEHRMLLLSAVREITERGISSDDEIRVAVRGLTELELTDELRAALIGSLCDHGNYAAWADSLSEQDYAGSAGKKLFGMLVTQPRQYAAKAYTLMKSCGADKLDPSDVAGLISYIISSGTAAAFDEAETEYLVGICTMLFDNKCCDDVMLGFLVSEYEGSIARMYEILDAAAGRGLDTGGLPEKILSVCLFTGSSEHIDETFGIYIEKGNYIELMVKAYFTVRCNDAFLHGVQPAPSMYEALESYMMNISDPLSTPLIYRLALTSHYAGMDELKTDELKLCQALTDDLISSGYVFAYTKKLRKKIHIPDDIVSRYFVQYNAHSEAAPKMLFRILPDSKEYRAADMQHIYKNIYLMSVILFKGDELQYIIYDNADCSEPSEEGIISVRKFHRQRDVVFASLDTMTKAMEDKDIGLLRENMLEYAEKTETVRLLFDLEN